MITTSTDASGNVTYHLNGLPALVLFALVGFLAYGWPAMKVARRTGKNRWLALLMAVPFVNIIVIWVFALSRWENVDAEGRSR